MKSLCVGIILFIFTCFGNMAAGENISKSDSYLPLVVEGSIYTDPSTSPITEYISTWSNYLYLSVRYQNGDQKLEVWNIRDPQAPVLVQSLDYGNILEIPQNHWRFPTVNVFKSTLIVRSNFSDYVYEPQPDGQLILKTTRDFSLAIDRLISETPLIMSSAGPFGAYYGRVNEPGDFDPRLEFGYIVLNFTNPTRPYMVDRIPGAAVFSRELNATLGNVAGSLRTNETTVFFSGYQLDTQTYFDTVWDPRFERIFNRDIFQRDLGDQIEIILARQNFEAMLQTALDRFFMEMDLTNETTVAQKILDEYENTRRLLDVLAEYDIRLDDSLRVAMYKIISKNISLRLEEEISASFFVPVFDEWMDDLFAIPIDGSKEEIGQSIAEILNDGITPDSAARFLLDNYVRPLAGEDAPEWLFWSLDQLVDEVVDSPAGEAVSAILEIAHTAVYSFLVLDAALALVPDSEQFELTAPFPKNCRQLLEYAFYEHGADLNSEGLAFMELLKFYQYFVGDDDYLNYEVPFADALKNIQSKLSDALASSVEPFLDTIAYVGDVRQRLQTYTGRIPSADIVSFAISDAILAQLEDLGVNTQQNVHQVLLDHQLYVDLTDRPDLREEDLAEVVDLIRVLDDEIDASEIRVRELFDRGGGYVDYLKDNARQALVGLIREAWGDLNLDISVKQALAEFIGTHVDSKWTFGQDMDDLLNDYVFSVLYEYPPFLDYLQLVQRAVKGDVIARWQLTFEIAAIVSSADPTGILTGTFISIETALHEAYQQALTQVIRSLLYDYVFTVYSQMFGNHSAWVSHTVSVHHSFEIQDLTTLNSVRTVPFTWEHRMGFIAREEWDYLNPRRVALVIFDPQNAAETKREIVLEQNWGVVDYVHSNNGIVMIGGSQYDGFMPVPTAQFIFLDEENIRMQSLHDPRFASAEAMFTANHGKHIILQGPGGIFILNNPNRVASLDISQDTEIVSWMLHD